MWWLFRPVLSRWHQSEETLPRPIDVVMIDPKSGFPEEDLLSLLPGRFLDDIPASWEC
jgi:hypothetical protein